MSFTIPESLGNKLNGEISWIKERTAPDIPLNRFVNGVFKKEA